MMTTTAPASNANDPVAELQDALARIRAGVPLASELQSLFHCAYVAGCVDSRRESIRNLTGVPERPVLSVRVEHQHDEETAFERFLNLGFPLRDIGRSSVLLNPRTWVPSLRNAFHLERQTVVRGVVLALLFAGWCWFWLTR